MNIILGSDLVPTEKNYDLFNTGDVKSLLGKDLYNMWISYDYRIFNLETPLCNEESPIEKWGPNLIAPTSTIKGIKALNPSLLTLANNHIYDQGLKGLNKTRDLLIEYNIPFFGAGDTPQQASAPYILEKNGIKIGFYTCAENEFTIVSDTEPGANPFDPLESLDHISKLKETCDYVIVLYHGGKEYYRYPSPKLQKICRKMVEKGADLVACQHSHCVGTLEKYLDSSIVYGQGNFIFNKVDNEFWNSGILIDINITNKMELNFIPIVRTEVGVKLAGGDTKKTLLSEFYSRSEKILDENFIKKEYEELAKKNREKYLRSFSGFGKWFGRVDRILLNGILVKQLYSKRKKLAMRNYVECEAHRELFITALKLEK